MRYVVQETQLNPAVFLACMADIWQIYFAIISMVEYQCQKDQGIGIIFFSILCVKSLPNMPRNRWVTFRNIIWESYVTDGFTKFHCVVSPFKYSSLMCLFFFFSFDIVPYYHVHEQRKSDVLSCTGMRYSWWDNKWYNCWFNEWATRSHTPGCLKQAPDVWDHLIPG